MEYKILPWDGTHLGNFSEKCITDSTFGPGGTDKFCKINIQNINFWCILNKFKNNFHIIIDECQEIFGLHRRQFHLINIDNIKYIAYKAQMKDDVPVWETPIKYLEKDESKKKELQKLYFIDNMRRLILVSDVLTCTRLTTTNIRMRKIKNIYQLVNYYTGNTCLNKNSSYDYSCSGKKLQKWFKNANIELEAKKIFNPENIELEMLVTSYRTKLKKCFSQHCKNYEWMINFIIDRIMRYL